MSTQELVDIEGGHRKEGGNKDRDKRHADDKNDSAEVVERFKTFEDTVSEEKRNEEHQVFLQFIYIIDEEFGEKNR